MKIPVNPFMRKLLRNPATQPISRTPTQARHLNTREYKFHKPLSKLSTVELVKRAAIHAAVCSGLGSKYMEKAVAIRDHDFANPTVRRLAYRALDRIGKETFIKGFFGGVSFEQAAETSKKLIKNGFVVVPDYSPESGGQEVRFDQDQERVWADIERFLDICISVRETSNTNYLPFAFKISSVVDQKTAKRLSSGLLSMSITSDDRLALDRLQDNVLDLFHKASKNNILPVVDAEESWINPLIHYVSFRALQENIPLAVTPQSYLKDSPNFVDDICDAHDRGWPVVAKIVCGAYHQAEVDTNPENPAVFTKKEETHKQYRDNLQMLLFRGVKVFIASHNEENFRFALKGHRRGSLLNDHSVYEAVPDMTFLTLNGMTNGCPVPADKSFGFYLPTVLAVEHGERYALRRGEELKGNPRELLAIWNELSSRLC